MRKAEVEAQAGPQGESLMWHGSFRASILKICQEVSVRGETGGRRELTG